MKVVEMIFEHRIRQRIEVGDMQFVNRPLPWDNNFTEVTPKLNRISRQPKIQKNRYLYSQILITATLSNIENNN